MKNLSFNSITLNPVTTTDNQIWLGATQLGLALGYANPETAITKIFNRNRDEFSHNMTKMIDMETNSGQQKTRIFSLRGCHLVAMFSRTKIAKDFRKWVLDILDKEVYQTGEQINSQVSKLSTKEERKPLRQAVTMLVDKKGISYEDAYHLIHQRFDIESVEELNQNQINEAIQYIHSLIIKGNELPALTPEYFTLLAQMIAGASKYAQMQNILDSKGGDEQRKILLDGWLESTYKNEKRGFLFFLDFELNDAISRAQRFLMEQASLLQQF